MVDLLCPKCNKWSDFNYTSDEQNLVCEKCGSEFTLKFTENVFNEGD